MPGAEILLQPGTLPRLLSGLAVTVGISAASVALSVPLGIAVGMLMTLRSPALRFVLHVYLDFIRVMPQLVLLYLVFFGSAVAWGWNLSGEVASVAVFTLWGAAELGDLVRGALQSIPSTQYDSVYVLGLTKRQAFLRVILPQTVSRLLPPAINLVTRIIKTTSLCMLIGVVEVLRVGQQIIDFNRFQYPSGSLWIYGTIFFLYFIVCWPLSAASRRLERSARR